MSEVVTSWSDWLLRIVRAPRWRTLSLIVTVWLALAVANYWLQRRGVALGTSKYFPLTVVAFAPHLRGLPWALLFVVLLATRLKNEDRFTTAGNLAICVMLVLLGNLAQGSLHDVFIEPFTQGHIQYYHDALTITDSRSFLSSFNTLQSGLRDHGRTHPPFAVLIHYWLLGPRHDRLWLLTLLFSAFSLLALPLFWLCVRSVGGDSRLAGNMVLLLAVTPAFNIYAIVCFDGLIAALGTLFLLSLINIQRDDDRFRRSLPLLVFSGVAINLLTFGGLFFLALLAMLAIYDLLFRHRARLFIANVALLGILIIVCVALERYCGYNHLRSFALASRLENPDGFRGFASPAAYLMTRLNDIWELALFASIPLLALLIQRKPQSLHRESDRLAAAAAVVLLGMFLAGAFKKGETARACLFVYPFLLLRACDTPALALDGTIAFAGLQTIVMQLGANFYW